MTIRSKQVLVGVLALTAVYVGAWATAAPYSFFTSFPLPYHHWVVGLGPYNEHLTRDVGGLFLALCVVSVWAAVRARAEQFAMAGAAWLVFSVPHLVFHACHLEIFSTGDVVGNVVTLGGTVVLAALLLVPDRGIGRSSGERS